MGTVTFDLTYAGNFITENDLEAMGRTAESAREALLSASFMLQHHVAYLRTIAMSYHNVIATFDEVA